MMFLDRKRNCIVLSLILSSMILSSCGSSKTPSVEIDIADLDAPLTEQVKGSRDNTPNCLIPSFPGTTTYENEYVYVDASNASEGYIGVKYTGESQKVKLQILCPNTVTYTYRLTDQMDVFPLTSESGTYTLMVFENIQDTQYSTIFSQDIDVSITNILGPYLYPNQYVNFCIDDPAISKASDLAYPANDDLEVVTRVYNYVTTHITYDVDLAKSVESGYVPDINNTYSNKTGICLDYSSLMASMLRSQNIPAHMEVGYAGTAYHAWISVYLEEIGWVNGIIEFDGKNWELMDPTFASSSSEKKLKEFIGDGTNYEAKYIY